MVTTTGLSPLRGLAKLRDVRGHSKASIREPLRDYGIKLQSSLVA